MHFIGATDALSGSIAPPGSRSDGRKAEASVDVAYDLELETVEIF